MVRLNQLIRCPKTLLHVTWLLLITINFWSHTTYAAEDKINQPLPTPIGRVIWVKGSLKATMPNSEVRDLQKSSVIYLHDTLTTDQNSQAQIAYTDNTLLTFKAGSKLTIDQYHYEPNKPSVGKYVMSLIEGGFRTITGLIAKNTPDEYKVNTPVATIGVRGTDYAISLTGGQLYVGYYSGSPCVSGGSSQLCLNPKVPFANVPKAGVAPIPLTQQPAALQEKLNIVPASVAPFKNTGNSGNTNSFCIQ